MLLASLGLDPKDSRAVKDLAKRTNISLTRLRLCDEQGIEPTVEEWKILATVFGQSVLELRLRTGFINRKIIDALSSHASEIAGLLGETEYFSNSSESIDTRSIVPDFVTPQGALYRGDCLDVMSTLPSESFDLIFADPPFNLDKLYPSEMDDNLRAEHYLHWCERWLSECARLLKDGGSMFVWNLPRWNTYLSAFLNRHLTFRHWIAVDVKYSLPLQSKLYPSHYSLLYYIKGERPATFHPDRLPMEICPDCYTDLKDYGGYKDKMNPKGVNLCDVWNDIPPVRHAKYKKRKSANELSIKLLDRVLEMASNEGDYVFDPFGGSGTTYAVAELKRRKWLGVELGPIDGIVERLENVGEEASYLERLRAGYNHLFLPESAKRRRALGRWTVGNIPKASNRNNKSVDHFNAPHGAVETQLSLMPAPIDESVIAELE